MVIFLLIFLFSLEIFSQEKDSINSIQDLGIYGTLFEIEEEDLLDLIERRLLHLKEAEDLQKHQEILVKRTQEKVLKPKPVTGIQRATERRVFYYDPTLTLPYDLKDQKGQVFQKKGTKVNPLETLSLSKDLVFLEGDDEDQLAWVQKSYIEPQKPLKVILVKGAPFKCEEKLKTPCYFDQEGVLTQKLGIKNVPARVSQEGLRLKIEEYPGGEGR